MQKINIVKSETVPNTYRLIINVNEFFSSGIILQSEDLTQLLNTIKSIKEKEEELNNTLEE